MKDTTSKTRPRRTLRIHASDCDTVGIQPHKVASVVLVRVLVRARVHILSRVRAFAHVLARVLRAHAVVSPRACVPLLASRTRAQTASGPRFEDEIGLTDTPS